MERSTSVPRGMGEQSLTPGEQRILVLMEQGQQRLEQQLERHAEHLREQGEALQGLQQELRKLTAAVEGLRP